MFNMVTLLYTIITDGWFKSQEKHSDFSLHVLFRSWFVITNPKESYQTCCKYLQDSFSQINHRPYVIIKFRV